MPVTFRVPSARSVDLVRFAWSPLFEAALSTRVVVAPKRRPLLLPWARRCRDLPRDLLDELTTLARPFDSYIPGVFEVGLLGDSPAFEDELAAFRALDLPLVAYEMSIAYAGLPCGDGGPQLVEDPVYRQQVVAGAARQGPEVAALARLALEDPGVLRERWASMLERYWDAAFCEEWERILPRIEAEVTEGARALVTRGVPGLVTELLPEGRWDADNSTIVVTKEWEGTCDVADRGGMLFVPTVYGWPCVLVELTPPWPVAVILPLRDLRAPEVVLPRDHEVADGLRALGDETRLQIARMVAEQPRSTKELAELLRLSDSAVSRHLKVLDGAGLVEGHRDGYYVLYRLRPERIAQLGGALRRTLGLTPAAPAQVPALPVQLLRTGA